MTEPLVVKHLTKVFPDGTTAVSDLSFSVGKGEFKALLGPNGSGKSTTLKMCCNLLDPTSGHVLFDGVDVSEDPSGALSHMGCVVETPALYRDRTVGETLRYICRLRGLGRESSQDVTIAALDRVGMSGTDGMRFGRMSKGMRQRVSLAQALLGNPDILILDEPTSGLDPVGVRDLEAIITGLNSEGMSVLMSSHMLHEVARTCDSYVFIRDGRLVSEGDVGSAMDGGGATVLFTRPLLPDEVGILSSIIGGDVSGGDSVRIGAGDRESRADLLRRMVFEGLPVCGLVADGGLEDMFTEVGDDDVVN